jgi:PAS domain S-box-containing protein
MIGGVSAVVWERELADRRPTYVSERAEELFGYPLRRWYQPAFWESIVHPEDRARATAEIAAGGERAADFETTYRVLAADRGVLWIRDMVHVVPGGAGGPTRLQGVLIDITEQKRRERDAVLLAEASRLIATPGPITERLTEVAEHLVAGLGELAVVSLRGDDGSYRPVAAAPSRVAATVLGLGPLTNIEKIEAEYQAGHSVVVPEVTDEMIRAGTPDEASYRALSALGVRASVNVPMISAGQLVGVLSLSQADPGRHEPSTVELVEEIGRRMSAMVAAEQTAARQRHIHRISTALAAARGTGEVAGVLTAGLADALGASAQCLYLVDDEAALTRLDRYATRVPGAACSTAICLLVDVASGALCWARAGHPPPLLLTEPGARFLEDAHGPVLGLPDRLSFVEGSAGLAPGDSVVLYTDGLVERRGEVVDAGLARLAATADGARGHHRRA